MATLSQLQAWKADADAVATALATLSAAAQARLAASSGNERWVMARRAGHMLYLIKQQQAMVRWLGGGVTAAQAAGSHPAMSAAPPTGSADVPGMRTIPGTPTRANSI